MKVNPKSTLRIERELAQARYAVQVGKRFIERFTYPSTAHYTKDKVWEASEGKKIALRCKAILGTDPFLWDIFDSAFSMACAYGDGAVAGRLVWVVRRKR
jgi:hypothetical protein